MIRRQLHLLFCLFLSFYQLSAQINSTANDIVKPYNGTFRPGTNLGYFPPWTDEELANIAAGNPELGIEGVGIKAIRPGLFGSFVEQWGYELRLSTYEHFKKLGLEDNTLIVGFPSEEHRDKTFYCDEYQSEMYANLYEPIWIDGENGKEINQENYYAHYLYRIVSLYGKHIKFWEIWNEPGFDYTGAKGWQPRGNAGNWWDNNPDPCDYKLRAPIFHYIRTLRISYEVIKALDEDAYVCVSGTGYPSFLDAIMRNTDNPIDGSVSEDFPNKGGAYFDVMGFHSYPHFDGATRRWSNQLGGFEYYRHSDAAVAGISRTKNIYNNILSQYGYDGNTYPEKHWIITEINVPRRSYSEYLGGENIQINFMMKAYLECVREDILQMHVYSLAEQKSENEAKTEFDLMGLYKKLKEITPYKQQVNDAGIAFKTTSDQLFGKKYDRARTAAMNLPETVDGGAFVDEQGFYTYMLWAKTQKDQSEEATAIYFFPRNTNIFELSLHQWDYSKTKESYLITPDFIELTSRPIFLQESIFTYKNPDCAPSTVTLNGMNSEEAASWEWEIDNGEVSTYAGRQITINYDLPGNYEVALTIKNEEGEIIAQQTDYILIKGTPKVEVEVKAAGPVLSISNNSESATQVFHWDFGDGNSVLAREPNYTYATSGTYYLTMTAENACGVLTQIDTLEIKLPEPDRLGYNANDQVPEYNGFFRPGTNLGYFPPWTDKQLSSIAAGDISQDIKGVGVKALRPAIYGSFVEEWGYDFRVETFEHYHNLGLKDNTLIVGFPSTKERDPNRYCPTSQSEMFENIYMDIWDDGTDGTPINEDNYYAAYLYELMQNYGPYVKFWEIWNEPGFDYTGGKGWLSPNQEGNWWVNDPDPCDYKLRAPIQHYIRVLRISYEVIKTLDPEAYVVLSGTGYLSFLDAVLRNTDNPIDGKPTADYPHGGGAYFDVMGFHSYPHFDGSTKFWDNSINAFAYKRHSDGAADGIMRVRNRMQNILSKYGYDGDTYPEKEWTITEINIPRRNFHDFVGGDEAQRNFMIKAYITSAMNDILQIHVYSLAEQKTEAAANYEFDLMGLYNKVRDTPAFTESKTDAGIAYKTTSDLLFGLAFDQNETNKLQLPDGVRGAAFKDPKGAYVYAIWAETRTDNTENADVIYSFPSSYGDLKLTRYEWDYSETADYKTIEASDIQLTGAPIFLATSPDILNAPVAGFKVAETVGCTPFEVHFEDLSKDAAEWEWTFEGGIPYTSNEANPIIIYQEEGIYPVTLKVKNAVDEHKYTFSEYIDVRPIPEVSFEMEVNGTEATFSLTSNIEEGTYAQYYWNFGNGIGFPANNPTHDFENNGTYEVTLVPFTQCAGDTVRQTVTIAAPPLAQMKANEQAFCDRKVVSFTNLSTNEVNDLQWYFPGATPARSSAQNVAVIYKESGTYEAILIVGNEYGYDTIRQEIAVDVAPRSRFERTICSSESIEINGTVYNQLNLYGIEFFPRGEGLCDSMVTVDLKLEVEPITRINELLCLGESIMVNGNIYDHLNPSGTERISRAERCDSVVIVNLNFYSTPVSYESVEICYGESVTIGSQIYSESGTYADTLLSAKGCDSIAFTQLYVEPSIEIANMIILEDDGTANGKIAINPSGGVAPYTIVWADGRTGNTIGNLAAGTYTVTITDQLGCSFSTEIEVKTNDGEGDISAFLYPNPVSNGNNMTIAIQSPIQQNVQILMYDIRGRLVKSEQQFVEIGATTLRTHAPTLAGSYFVRIIFERSVVQFNHLQLVTPKSDVKTD